MNTQNNNISTNANYLSRINFGSNTGNISNSSNSINFTTYAKLESKSVNKSNDLISPKNIFNTQNMSSNKKLKDFVNLYSKKKLFKNTRNNIKVKEGLESNKIHVNTNPISKYKCNTNFLTEQINQ